MACQHRALLACQCLCETGIQMHREGYRLEDVQLIVAAAGLASGNKLLTALEQEVLLSWVAVVFLSLQEAGVPCDLKEHSGRDNRPSTSAETSRMVQGIAGALDAPDTGNVFPGGIQLSQAPGPAQQSADRAFIE
ncbi:hypothetical protein WJX84_011863 [Apatococcus fuscideae]|uniref:Uncharacterized protein n=1 Tax=Apatococcus fuscideae TaxID=2026836 RepID=A0AAW1SR45_9CHLO